MHWSIKITAKLILARLPIPYRQWAGMGLFKHGAMADMAYAQRVFNQHFERAHGENKRFGGVYLELGPGDSLSSAILARSRGAQEIYLVDVGNFATRDMAFYTALASEVGEDVGQDFDEMLAKTNAQYLTQGLRSLKALPDNSVDYVWSHSCVEHIRKKDFDEMFAQLYRVLKTGGVMSHSIDLQDHLGGQLNNCRFSDEWWEKDWVANSGFYTNRLRASEIVDSIIKAGFTIKSEERGHWPKIPTPRKKLALPYSKASDEDLLTRTQTLLIKRV